ncbi:MAG: mechanosensitive ion channel domain-containing protein [Burkholderiales bacterium]|jgi:small-conductance mechanosensitive channel
MNGFEFDLHLLGPLVNRLLEDLGTVRGWWAAGAVAACLGLAWWIAGSLERRLEAKGPARLAAAWAQRVAWPLMALLLMLVARAVLQRFVPVSLLSVAIALMVSLAAVRTLVLILRQTFREQARWMAPFERTISTIIWTLVALHVLDLLPVLVETLESIAIPIGKSKLTLMQVISGLFTVGLAGMLALWASRAIDARLADASGVDLGARAVISRVAQPVLMTLALLIALPMIGIDLTTLSVFSGALGVGLGFGMQKIAANYISGFIILLDRSIEPGRMIRVGVNRGTVVDIRTRYTVLRGMDGVDSIVPNEMLIGTVVESETFTNTRTRAAVQVGVGYASDVERAMELMVEAATTQARVLGDPAPQAFLVAFADSGITLEVGFWIDDPMNGTLALRSAVNLEILRRFREQGIEIPFPQREVTIRGGAAVAAQEPVGASAASSQVQPPFRPEA